MGNIVNVTICFDLLRTKKNLASRRAVLAKFLPEARNNPLSFRKKKDTRTSGLKFRGESIGTKVPILTS